MADAPQQMQSDPFAQYNEQQRAGIRKQLTDLQSSGQLNDKQKAAVVRTLGYLAPKAKPASQPGYWSQLGSEALAAPGRAIQNVFEKAPQYMLEAGRPRTPQEKPYGMIPGGGIALSLKHQAQDIYGQFDAAVQAADREAKEGAGRADQILTYFERLPFIGDIVQHAESGGPHPLSPQSIGAGIEGATYAGMGGVKDPAAADWMRRHGGAIESKRLHLGPESGYELGRTKTVGTLESLATKRDPVSKQYIPGKVRQFIETQIKPKVAQGLHQADATGVTQNIQADVDMVARTSKAGARTSQVSPITKMLQDVYTQPDPVTGKPVPRNLAQMRPSDMYRLTQQLNDIAFDESHGKAVQATARNLRDMVGKQLDRVAPGIARLRATESALIQADDVISQRYADRAKGLSKDRMRSWIAGGAPTIVVYMALRDLGGDYALAAGSAMAMAEIMKMPSLATLRGAAWNVLADMIDNPAAQATRVQARRQMGPQGPQAGGGGPAPTVPTPQGGPQVGPPPQGVPGGQAAPATLPAGPQTAPAQGVTGGGRGTPQGAAVPAIASGQPPVNTVAATQWHNQALSLATQELGETASLSKRLQRAAEIQKAGPEAYVAKPKALPEKSATSEASEAKQPTEVTVAPAEASGTSAKTKAMLDRIDTLLARTDVPKSTIDRELADIKKAISKDTSEADRKLIETRVEARERQAKHREKARAESPGAVAGGGPAGVAIAEPAAHSASPEQHAMVKELGFQELAKLPGGAELAQRIRQYPDNAQVEALTQAIEFLKKHGKELPSVSGGSGSILDKKGVENAMSLAGELELPISQDKAWSEKVRNIAEGSEAFKAWADRVEAAKSALDAHRAGYGSYEAYKNAWNEAEKNTPLNTQSIEDQRTTSLSKFRTQRLGTAIMKVLDQHSEFKQGNTVGIGELSAAPELKGASSEDIQKALTQLMNERRLSTTSQRSYGETEERVVGVFKRR